MEDPKQSLEHDLMLYGTGYLRVTQHSDGETLVKHVPLTEVHKDLEELNSMLHESVKFLDANADS